LSKTLFHSVSKSVGWLIN